VLSVAFSPDGTGIVSGSIDKTLRVWDSATGECTATLEGHTDWVMSVAFSPDGTGIVSGSGDKTVRVWDSA
jgi:WD40 repeat protein